MCFVDCAVYSDELEMSALHMQLVRMFTCYSMITTTVFLTRELLQVPSREPGATPTSSTNSTSCNSSTSTTNSTSGTSGTNSISSNSSTSSTSLTSLTSITTSTSTALVLL
jgi:hypothetical protein